MEIAKIQVSGTSAQILSRRPIPAGIIGGYITVEYMDDVWSDLSKTVVFRSNVTRDVLTNDNKVLIPGETVALIGECLHVGFYGINMDGTLAIPTFWTDLGIIVEATDPCGDERTDPSLPVWAQVQHIIEQGTEILAEGETAIQKLIEVTADAEQAVLNAGFVIEGTEKASVAANIAAGLANEAANSARMEAANAAGAASSANAAADAVLAAKDSFLTTAGAAMEEIRNVVDDGTDAPPIVCTASGNVISLKDSAKRFLQGLTIYGKTTQDGTPTPDVPVELNSVGDGGRVGVTVCGKNLFALAEQGSVGMNGVEYDDVNTRRTPYIKVSKGETYVFSKAVELPETGFNGVLRLYDADKNFVTTATALLYNALNGSYTVGDGIQYMRFVQFGYTAVSDINIQIEKGSTVTEYDGAKAQILPISTPNGLPGIPVTSGGDYTDENGQQWICDEVDFARGKYVQRIGRAVFDGSADESWARETTNKSDKYRVKTNLLKGSIAPVTASTEKGNLISSALITTIAGTNGTWGANEGISVDASGSIFCYCETYSTSGISLWTDYLTNNPMTVIYELAEEKHIPLSAEELAAYAALHTNYPNTTIYNDGNAHMEVKYVADTKMYVDKKFHELATALLNNA